jgi:hypothetical protein
LAYADSDTETLPLTFAIEPVTVVKVASSGGMVRIGPVVSGTGPTGQVLQVSIATNTEEPYEVFHELHNDITSNGGSEFLKEELVFQVSSGNNGGSSKVSSPTEVPKNRSSIFYSSGGEDLFNIQYVVANKKTLTAGNYYGNVSITLENA